MTIKAFYRANPMRFCLLIMITIIRPWFTIFNTMLVMYETTAIKDRHFKIWLLLEIVSFVILAGDYAIESFADYLSAKQVEQYNFSLRAEIVAHFYADGQNHQIGQVQNRLTNDLKQNAQNYLLQFLQLVNKGSMLLAVFTFLLTLHWSLLLTIILMTAISLTLPKLIEKPLQKAMMQISDSNQKYLDSLEKWLSGLDELRRYLASDKLFHVMARSSKELEDANVKQTTISQSLTIVTGLVSEISSGLLYALAGILIVQHVAIFGVITAVGNCEYYLTNSINRLVTAQGQMKGAKALNHEIAATAARIPPVKQEKLQIPVALTTSDLSLKFPNGASLAFPDIDVKKGEKILLTGDSGAGKTTLFKLLLGEIKPATGKVVYKDELGRAINPDMSKIGYIPQAPILFPATIADNMTMFNVKLKNRLEPLVEKVQFAGDVAMFNDGLDEEIDLDKLNVSGGQRQKIVLVRALVHQSEIILIDEGTSAIDQKATMEILRHVTSSDATVLFIAHSFNDEMKKLFDREIHLVKNKK
ncbi:ABC transporter ATP-binding protein [Lactobacillus sp. ESL0791]|uniref:ATP-binding cassette domain-containing protein n=1 Tax=Lactobacillus sp. ESL0791 TaxID=2983234 RepID=UPI0023F775EF|nr:ABC transporter ATP-binding protein [Lactobacillus sp. ESL0791]MDF7638332.1 ABC transporter ATP-binding protein [Lactobacillus sp. ESL0791]